MSSSLNTFPSAHDDVGGSLGGVRAYTSTLHAHRVTAILAAGSTILAALCCLMFGAPKPIMGWVIVTCVVVTVLSAFMLGCVQWGVNHTGLSFRSGILPWQTLGWDQIESLTFCQVSWGGVVGIGIPPTLREYRHIITPGQVLHLRLTTGADYWVSAPASMDATLLNSFAPIWCQVTDKTHSVERTVS